MNKLILAIMMMLPLSMMAQTDWELPQNRQKTAEEAKTTWKSNTTKSTKNGEAKVEKVKKEKPQKVRISKIDPKYGVGAVPEVDGRVEWSVTVSLPGVPADKLYEKMQTVMQDIVESAKRPQDKCFIAALNRREHAIAASMDEYIVFHSMALSLDRTIAHYTLLASCDNGKATLRMCRLSYDYAAQSTTEHYSAEERITDKAAMNKSQTKFYPHYGKFRTKTIDRKDAIFQMFEEGMKR